MEHKNFKNFKCVVEVPPALPSYFFLERQGAPTERSRRERYYYLPVGRWRNIKLVADAPLDQLVEKVVVAHMSWDDNSNRPEDKPAHGLTATAGGMWRLYLYGPLERQPSGEPAHSDWTIKISYDHVDDNMLSAYKVFPLYPQGTVLFGPKVVPISQARIFTLIAELERVREADPLRFIEAERAVRRLEL